MSYDGIPCSATLKVLARTAYFSIDRHLEIELCGSRWISQALCAAFATLCTTSKSIAGLLMCFEKEGSVHEPIRGQVPPVPASPMAWQGKTMSARWISVTQRELRLRIYILTIVGITHQICV